MTQRREHPPRLESEIRARRGWARYWRLKRRAAVQRHLWVRTFEEYGDLYGSQWESTEAQRIRDECEESGVPMGYGRVGRVPEQLPRSIAVPVDAKEDEEDSEALTEALESDDEAPR